MDAEGARHVLVHDVVDAEGGPFERETEWLRYPLGNRRFGAGEVEAHCSAEEVVGVQVAEDEVGVAERRLRSPLRVAGGARGGSGALRTDPDGSPGIRLRDAATPRADLDHVDDRGAHRQPAPRLELVRSRDLERVDLHRRALTHQRPFGGGASHVEGEQVRQGEGAAVDGRHPGAGCGARFDDAHGKAAGEGWGQGAAARAHHVETTAKAEPGEPLSMRSR